MTEVQNNLALKLLQEHFGDVVMNVGKCLLERGILTLREIITQTNSSADCVKYSLLVLIEHNFVSFDLNSHGIVSYKIKADDIFPMLNFPLYVEVAQKLFNIEGKLITEVLLTNGKLKMSKIVEKVKSCLENSEQSIEVQTIRNQFENMVDNHFIQRCPSVLPDLSDHGVNNPVKTALIPKLVIAEHELYTIPNWECDERARKRLRTDESVTTSNEVYWKIHYDKFNLYLRNQIIIKSIESRFDSHAAIIIETMLNLNCADSVPISKIMINNALPSDADIQPMVLDQYLSCLADDSTKIIAKVDDHQGGTYCLRLIEFIESLTWAMIEKIVNERFSSKHCRIFRLIRLKKNLEQKEIESMSMILAKQAKLITYSLLEANFIHMKEVSLTADHTPAKTIFLFCIKFPQTVRMLLEWLQKSLFNLKVARECEEKQNKRLLDKKQKINSIIEVLKSQNADPNQIAEIEEMITPPEVLVLERVQKACGKLEIGELNLLESLLIINCCKDFMGQ